ncbi:leucine-rich repeat extensin-like protein 3 [Helianthus annuus]|uniref:leucine-rich repeat extensin-like protein 3 n=1 Tax=Helianthus annuus TaxID=4232 RepID=UPI000B8FC3B2|nr:leucine-rich repeat extensin-like protein 3 [Helianthus annuus]
MVRKTVTSSKKITKPQIGVVFPIFTQRPPRPPLINPKPPSSPSPTYNRHHLHRRPTFTTVHLRHHRRPSFTIHPIRPPSPPPPRHKPPSPPLHSTTTPLPPQPPSPLTTVHRLHTTNRRPISTEPPPQPVHHFHLDFRALSTLRIATASLVLNLHSGEDGMASSSSAQPSRKRGRPSCTPAPQPPPERPARVIRYSEDPQMPDPLAAIPPPADLPPEEGHTLLQFHPDSDEYAALQRYLGLCITELEYWIGV